MKYLPDSLQMKNADQYTIEQSGVPSLKLMENAAKSCIDVLKEKNVNLSHICIICGSGNNGGDGFAIGRILADEGYKVTAIMAGNAEKCTTETKQQMEWFLKTGNKIENHWLCGEYSVIIDSIFGVGLSRKIEGKYYDLIEQLNQIDAYKVAVDISSGISADSGAVLGIGFKADLTVTFQAAKTGHILYPGKEYSGEVVVKDIGISEEYFRNNKDVAITYDKHDYKDMLPVRKEESHKGSYGKLLIIAGSKGMSGAAYLNAMAAYMAGAGLVQIYTTEDNRIILQQLIPEAIISTYESFDEKQLNELIVWADGICIGSGLGVGQTSRKILKKVIETADCPCLIDADGLNMLENHSWYLDKIKHQNYIVTPHMKEMSRLTGLDISAIRNDRLKILKEFTDKYGITCVLKDARTCIRKAGSRAIINLTGNSAMAKAGSGDVLAGIISGLMVQGINCEQAAILGTYLHGRCGDTARCDKGSYSVMARDLIENLSTVLKEEERG